MFYWNDILSWGLKPYECSPFSWVLNFVITTCLCQKKKWNLHARFVIRFNLGTGYIKCCP